MKEYFGSESLNLLNQESLRTPILVDNQEMPYAYQSENATGTQDQDTKDFNFCLCTDPNTPWSVPCVA